MDSKIEIHALRALAEMYPAVELQKVYWGDELESVIPAHMLFSLANHGGHVLAASDGDRLIGLLVGFLGTSKEDINRPALADLQIVSKRMVVLPEYRNQGVAYQLKLAQREVALRQGVRLVTWTFDPLLSTNAHLNIRKLGAVVDEYLQDYYGTAGEGGLVTLGSSDRLFAEWWVTHRRVKERIEGERSALTLQQYLEGNAALINPTRAAVDGLPWPTEQPIHPAGSMVLLEIPSHFQSILRADETLAMNWRQHTRALFTLLFSRGYIVTDFLHEPYEGRPRSFYLLSHRSPQFDFSMN